MRAPVTPLGCKLSVVAMAMLLALTFTYPASADESVNGSDAPMLASLMSGEAAHVSVAVALEDDPEPVVGSFAMDGLTYIILHGERAMLVSVGPDALALADAAGSSGAEGGTRSIGSGALPRSAAEQAPSGATSPQSQLTPSAEAFGSADGDSDEASGPAKLILPEFVDYDGATYIVAAIGPWALAGCNADVVTFPATVESVDDSAFRGSAIPFVEVADGNPYLASYEGVLYNADYSHLLLIPEGKKGVVRIHKNTSVVPPSAFSHCAGVESVEVDAGNESFYVEDGVLLDNNGKGRLLFSSADIATRSYGLHVDLSELVLDGYARQGDDDGLVIDVPDTVGNGRPAYVIAVGRGTTETRMETPDGVLKDTYGAGARYQEAYATHFMLLSNGRWQRGKNATTHYIIRVLPSSGYEFAGWFKDASCTQPYQAGDWMLTSGCYALFDTGGDEITFDANGGSGGQDGVVRARKGQDMPAISGERPVRSGYLFNGWFDGPDYLAPGTIQYYDENCAGIGIWNGASDTTLYAGWEAIPYAISYDAQGGELPEGARSSYTIEDAFELPVPTRYGYQLQGWEVAGVAEDGTPGPVQGSGVEDAALEDGSKATRVKAGTYGDLACTARWALRYDLDVPVADPGSVTFEADSLTGQVRVRPGTSAEGEIRSFMAEPVALDELACEGLGPDGEAAQAGEPLELEAIFGAGSASKVRFTATVGEGAGAATHRLSPGGTASLSAHSIPAATSHDAPGRLAVTYGLELDPDLPIPPVREAAPVARLTYTVSLPAPGA